MALPRPFSQPLTSEEEDRIILERITINERPLRTLIKKFHNYALLSQSPLNLLDSTVNSSALDDSREAFLVELASFELLMKKSKMICEAESRQVEEYQRERERLDSEHETLKSQIEELKTALEHAQMLRRRKIEYDLVAEKVNTLPTREELEMTIQSLENDMAAIRSEHDTQNRTVESQRYALDSVVRELTSLSFLGKDPEPTPTVPQSPRETPLESMEPGSPESSLTSLHSDSEHEEGEEVEEGDHNKPILPNKIEEASEGVIEEDDIEMGEVEESPRDKNKRKVREDMEEGEATDGSSELSDPPDD